MNTLIKVIFFILFLFLFFFLFYFLKKSLGLNRENHETYSRFSNPGGSTEVRTVHWIFYVERFLEVKESFQGAVSS